MGWLELKAWIREVNRQRRGREVSPDSWTGREQDPFWQQQDAIRRRRAGL